MGYQKPLYLTVKRGVYYYMRRVPQSLKAQFQSPRFVNGSFEFFDVIGERIVSDKKLVCDGLVVGGVYW